MPTITQELVQGFAHCRNSLCDGNEQEAVDALRERSDTTYAEVGGDMPGIERTTFRLTFANVEDTKCETCLEDREVSDQVRPVYPSMVSAFGANSTDQRFLLKLQQSGKIRAPGDQTDLGTSDAVERELAELRRELAEMRGFAAGQAGSALGGGSSGTLPEPALRGRPAQQRKG